MTRGRLPVRRGAGARSSVTLAGLTLVGAICAGGCQPTYDDAALAGTWVQIDGDAQRLVIKPPANDVVSATMTLRGRGENSYNREYTVNLRRDAVGGVLMESVDVFTTSSTDPQYRLTLSVDQGRLLCTGCVLEGDELTCEDAPFSKRSPDDPYLSTLRCKWRRVR